MRFSESPGKIGIQTENPGFKPDERRASGCICGDSLIHFDNRNPIWGQYLSKDNSKSKKPGIFQIASSLLVFRVGGGRRGVVVG